MTAIPPPLPRHNHTQPPFVVHLPPLAIAQTYDKCTSTLLEKSQDRRGQKIHLLFRLIYEEKKHVIFFNLITSPGLLGD